MILRVLSSQPDSIILNGVSIFPRVHLQPFPISQEITPKSGVAAQGSCGELWDLRPCFVSTRGLGSTASAENKGRYLYVPVQQAPDQGGNGADTDTSWMYLNGDVSWVSQPKSATARLKMAPAATGGLCVGETTPKSAGASPATG